MEAKKNASVDQESRTREIIKPVENIFKQYKDVGKEGEGMISKLESARNYWETANPRDLKAFVGGYSVLASVLVKSIENRDPDSIQHAYDEMLELVSVLRQKNDAPSGSIDAAMNKNNVDCLFSSGEQIRRIKDTLTSKTELKVEHMESVRRICGQLTEKGTKAGLEELREYIAKSIVRAVREAAPEKLDQISAEIGGAAEKSALKGFKEISKDLDGIYYLTENILTNTAMKVRQELPS